MERKESIRERGRKRAQASLVGSYKVYIGVLCRVGCADSLKMRCAPVASQASPCDASPQSGEGRTSRVHNSTAQRAGTQTSARQEKALTPLPHGQVCSWPAVWPQRLHMAPLEVARALEVVAMLALRTGLFVKGRSRSAARSAAETRKRCSIRRTRAREAQSAARRSDQRQNIGRPVEAGLMTRSGSSSKGRGSRLLAAMTRPRYKRDTC